MRWQEWRWLWATVSMPHKFMRKKAQERGVVLPKQYAVAMIFTKDEKNIEVFEKKCLANDLKIVMSRDVPIDTDALGEYALESLPMIKQIFVVPNSIMSFSRFDAMVYLTRKEVEYRLKEDKDFYISSFSTSVISYKGLLMQPH